MSVSDVVGVCCVLSDVVGVCCVLSDVRVVGSNEVTICATGPTVCR